MPPLRCRPPSRASARLREHFDRVHRALLKARSAARAAVVLKPVAVSRAQLDHRILRARTQAPIALAAVPARQAPLRLERRLLRRQATDDLLEIRDALGRLQLGLPATGSIAEVPQVQHLKRCQRVLGRALGLAATEPGVDLVRGPLAVPHADRHGALTRNHVPAGEYARAT